jgi:hypothetical protein
MLVISLLPVGAVEAELPAVEQSTVAMEGAEPEDTVAMCQGKTLVGV